MTLREMRTIPLEFLKTETLSVLARDNPLVRLEVNSGLAADMALSGGFKNLIQSSYLSHCILEKGRRVLHFAVLNSTRTKVSLPLRNAQLVSASLETVSFESEEFRLTYHIRAGILLIKGVGLELTHQLTYEDAYSLGFILNDIFELSWFREAGNKIRKKV